MKVKPKINVVAKGKFTRELEEIFEHLAPCDNINYSKFVTILNFIGALRDRTGLDANEKHLIAHAWNLINADKLDEVSKLTVENFLFGLFNYSEEPIT